MKCFICSDSFPDNRSLIAHILSVHSHTKFYKCAELNCARNYCTFDSFKKHRLREHSNDDEIGDECHGDESKISTSSYSYDVRSEISLEDLSLAGAQNIPSTHDFMLSSTSTINNVTADENAFSFVNNQSSQSSIDELNVFELSADLFQSAADFSARLYNSSEIPRSKVTQIITEIRGLLDNDIVNRVHNHLLDRLETLGESPTNLVQYRHILKSSREPFNSIASEHKILSHFQTLGTYIPPEQVVIGEREEYRSKNSEQVLVNVPVTIEIIPIRSVIKKVFELPGFFDRTMQYIHFCTNASNTIIYNLVQCSLYQAKVKQFYARRAAVNNEKILNEGEKSDENIVVMPLFLYDDAVAHNNPLGSHKGIATCGAVYCSIPCLPPEMQSKIENIFLLALYYSLDRDTYGNKLIYAKVIEELQFLQNEGITIEFIGGSKRVFFIPVLILGDNLGLHEMLGFPKSFNSHYFCRFCLTKHSEINSTYCESDCTLRNVENYVKHLPKDGKSEFGIMEECVFHDIDGFHATSNLAVDVMHDLLEGVCAYDMALILNQFVSIQRLFSLAELNARIRGFFYGANDGRNRPGEILGSNLTTGRLAMSAAEMLCLMRHVCLMLGNAVLPDNLYWELLVKLKKLVDIVTANCHVDGTHHLLRVLVSEYLQLHSELFCNKLKPKHHFLLHYARIMDMSGPLWKICSMRFESKHQDGKKVSRACLSRVNVIHSIAIRNQMRLNYRLISQKSTTGYKLFDDVGPTELVAVNTIDFAFVSSLLEKLPRTHGCLLVCKFIWYLGSIIQKDVIIMTPAARGPVFNIIHTIILGDESNVTFVVKKLNDCLYDDHFQAYSVLDIENYSWDILDLQSLLNHVLTHFLKIGQHYYIPKKWV